MSCASDWVSPAELVELGLALKVCHAGTVLEETVSPSKHSDTFAVLEQMDNAHPTYSHWYLPWFGVDSVLQGRGLGVELMQQCLEIVDESQGS